MDFEHLMEVQSALNDFTLSEKGVYVVDSQFPGAVVPNIIEARMALRRRDGEMLRHQSGLIRLCDMYQWAGNREFLELVDCYGQKEEETKANARIEVVDVMHFDLSLLALTCTTNEEVEEAVGNKNWSGGIDVLSFARSKTDDLQLTKWWTSNKVSVTAVRECAIIQFALLLKTACEDADSYSGTPLFESLEDVVDTYKKKVEVNYERVKANYDHVTDAEMGNENLK